MKDTTKIYSLNSLANFYKIDEKKIKRYIKKNKIANEYNFFRLNKDEHFITISLLVEILNHYKKTFNYFEICQNIEYLFLKDFPKLVEFEKIQSGKKHLIGYLKENGYLLKSDLCKTIHLKKELKDKVVSELTNLGKIKLIKEKNSSYYILVSQEVVC